MPTQSDDLLRILQECFNPREEGWLWLATYSDGVEGGVVGQFEGAYEDVSATAKGLALVINGCGADRAHLSLCRQEGRPTEADRRLWRELRAQVAPERLTDMVVFNGRAIWSMRGEDLGASLAGAEEWPTGPGPSPLPDQVPQDERDPRTR